VQAVAVFRLGQTEHLEPAGMLPTIALG
jgi:hypothetical protein